MRRASSTEKKRLNLDLPVEVREIIEKMREETQADSLGEVIRRAISVYRFLLDERKASRRIISRGSDEDRELILP